ncbi:MAG: Fic family protein [Solirubrobacterales bacterium]
MLFATPRPSAATAARLDRLGELRRRLGDRVSTPSPWLGTLRRQVQAASVEGSTSIEGFRLPPGEVGAHALSPGEEESRLALACYARAMDHVGVMASDPGFLWSDRVLLDLHFDACHFQREKSPGQWRTGPITVSRSEHEAPYRAPDAGQVPELIGEMVRWLNGGDLEANVVVRAAIAHLHLVSIHPFRDGNGRLARIVQSLVLAREGILSPEFGSIEEYLGANTAAYYSALREAQGEHYEPGRDASGWVDFCIDAHLAQTEQRLAQVSEAGARWAFLERLVGEHRWPERLVIALEQSLLGGTDRATYAREAAVSMATASADLRRLRDAGLVAQVGRSRNIRYHASDALRGRVTQALSREGRGEP